MDQTYKEIEDQVLNEIYKRKENFEMIGSHYQSAPLSPSKSPTFNFEPSFKLTPNTDFRIRQTRLSKPKKLQKLNSAKSNEKLLSSQLQEIKNDLSRRDISYRLDQLFGKNKIKQQQQIIQQQDLKFLQDTLGGKTNPTFNLPKSLEELMEDYKSYHQLEISQVKQVPKEFLKPVIQQLPQKFLLNYNPSGRLEVTALSN